MDFKTLLLDERDDGIAILTLNRPEKLNAINMQMIDDFNAAMDHLYHSFDTRVVILTGANRTDGSPVFSAGLDLKEAAILDQKSPPEGSPDYLRFPDYSKRFFHFQKELSNTVRKIRAIPQPVIAAIRGPAVGWGFAIASASDIRVAGRSAKFINAFIKIGAGGADCGSSYYLPRLIGLSRATEIIMTGRDVTAEEMERYGYLARLVDDGAVMDAAMVIAHSLLEKSPLGLKLTKEALAINADAPGLEPALALEDRNQNIASQAKDSKEGAYAFFEKRPPKYGKR
nr:enoyl-CoA hydratase/isomerase family protein [Candidatus Sigynarchaeum springense]